MTRMIEPVIPQWIGMLPSRRQHQVAGCDGCQASLRDPHNAHLAARDLGVGVIPDSDLARLLARLRRPDRRLVLAAVFAKPGPRRARLQRAAVNRLNGLGIEPA